MKVKRKILEDLSALEHNQWVHWAKDIAETENINPERLAKWKKLFVPYEELTDKSKDDDRVYAKKAYAALKKL